MKKASFITLWVLLFQVVAFLIWGVVVLIWGPPKTSFWTEQQILRWWHLRFYGRFLILGLPLIGLILGFLGVLPGTRTRK